MSEWKQIPVDDSGLSTRAKNSLRRGGLYSLGDVALASDFELLSCPELGRGSLKEIRDYIEQTHEFIGGHHRIQLERQLAIMEERAVLLAQDIAKLKKRLA